MSTGQGNSGSKSQKQFDLDKLMVEHSPAIIKFINEYPNTLFAKILSLLAGFIYKDGEAEFPPLEAGLEDVIKQMNERKDPVTQRSAARKLDAAFAPQAYIDSIGNPDKPGEAAQTITTRYMDSAEKVTLTLKKFVNDTDTGFKGAIYQDVNGHTVTIFGGMDSLGGFEESDKTAIVQAGLRHRVNHQTFHAQEMYAEATKMAMASGAKTSEIVGYSLGAMLANDISARLGAQVTNMADIGLPVVHNTDGKNMYNEKHFESIKKNVVSLTISNDPYYGAAGTVYGREVNLGYVSPQHVINAMGGEASLPEHFNGQNTVVPHRPEAYALAVANTTGGAALAVSAPAIKAPGTI